VPGLIAFVAALAAIEGRLIQLDHRDITKLLRIGTVYGNPARVPHGVFVFRGSTGYDGQFYYRLALDPANLHKTAFGITMDAPYRFMRIGYSALAWLVSLGHYTAVPYALVAINVAALGYLGGLLAREAGRHAIWGLPLVGYFGLMDSLSRDLTEPLGALCLIAGVLAYRKRHPPLAAAAFSYGVLTRETVLVAPVALGIVRVIQIARRRDRPGPADLAWLVPGVVFAAWEVVVKVAAGVFPILAGRRQERRAADQRGRARGAAQLRASDHASAGRPRCGDHLGHRVRRARAVRGGRADVPAGHHDPGVRAARLRAVHRRDPLPGSHELGRLRRPAAVCRGVPVRGAGPVRGAAAAAGGLCRVRCALGHPGRPVPDPDLVTAHRVVTEAGAS
jgi:hypothetical protein